MPADLQLVERLRRILGVLPGIHEKKMFGGVCFMVGDHMSCGVAGDELMLRLGEEGATAALAEPHVRPMDFTGRPMKSMVFVQPGGLGEDTELAAWVERAVIFARSLPPKNNR